MGTLVPFMSDLDISIWFETPLTRAQSDAVHSILERVSRTLPLARDVNIYSRGDAEFVERWMNPHEMERDPMLVKHLGCDPARKKSSATRTAFLLRMLESDAHHLLSHPKTRMLKWQFHFSDQSRSFQQAWSSRDPRERVRQLLHLVLEPLDQRYVEPALEFLTISPVKRQAGEAVHGEILVSIFPHRFTSLAVNPSITQFDEKLFLAQLEWELWGLGTQVWDRRIAPSFPRHLRNIQSLIDRNRSVMRDASYANAVSLGAEDLVRRIQALA